MLEDSDFLIQHHLGGSVKTSTARTVYAIPTAHGVLPAAGTKYVDLSGVFKPGATNVGAFVQSSAAITLRMTMASVAEVRSNPEGVVWSPAIAVAAGVIKLLSGADGNPVVGSCLEIVSTGRAQVYLGSL